MSNAAAKSELIRTSLREGWGHGIDVVGSMKEGVVRDRQKEDSTIKLLTSYVETLGDQGILRFHVFEGAREGVFYNAFWKAMGSLSKIERLPKQIIIGHINTLNREDIDNFKLIRQKLNSRTEFIFNANIESNLRIQSDSRPESLKKLVQSIKDLHQAEFKVFIGSDGQGILGPSSTWIPTFRILKDAGLDKSSLIRLLEDSKLNGKEQEEIRQKFSLQQKSTTSQSFESKGKMMDQCLPEQPVNKSPPDWSKLFKKTP